MLEKNISRITYQFGLDSELVDDGNGPDSFEAGLEKPDKGFIVARDINQNAISVYRDNQWDWSAYHPYSNNFVLDFTSWHKGELNSEVLNRVEDIKWLMFIIVWISKGRSKAPSTISLYLRLFNKLAESAIKNKVSIINILQEPNVHGW